ncbi:alpha/beta fold hydrolase [Tepidiforma sp.]|uniref:alpha/beta fold hydrolase n=1 Tax=Tepidiforma sp. TaxID=2682230 RepID=UPI002ADE36C6|nr:alpha/beta fold hydrolase [Tepidiforma sp.]
MPHLDRDGVSIFYQVAGSGPAILLSHGYSATSRMWDAQVSALSPEYAVVTWDMRGHGQSDSPDDPSAYSEAHTVADMAAILDALGVESAVIGGLSLGGYMSLAFHLAHPDRVRALMLFDTGPGYRNPAGREAWNRTAEARAVAFETRGLEALGPGAEVRIAAHRSARGLALAARGMLAQFDSRIIESLPSIAVPTLVLVGEKDEPFLGATDYMAAKIPGARKVVIPGAGHAANIDQPEAFNRAVREFLASLP